MSAKPFPELCGLPAAPIDIRRRPRFQSYVVVPAFRPTGDEDLLGKGSSIEKEHLYEFKETTRMTAPITSNTLGLNVFTAPGKAMVGERPRPFGEALGF